MFAYARAAIDFWPGWLAESEFREQLSREYAPDDASKVWAGYQHFRAGAMEAARKIGWEGDIRSGPFVSGLPTGETADDGHVMIAWKQDNNGDTFVAAPYRLPWLERGEYGNWIET